MTNALLDSTAIANAIAQAMHGAITRHSMELDEIKAEADAVQARRDGEQVTREGTLRALAAMSATNAWTSKQVDAGAALVASMSNGKLPASVKTFANELRVVMQPATREAFPSIMDAALEVWAAEDLQRQLDGKEAVTPARKAWKRRYHTIVTATQALPTKGRLLNTPDLITAYAIENDPDIDAKKAAKRIDAIRDELSAIAVNFPEGDIKAAYDLLVDVTEALMVAARDAMLAKATPVVGGVDPTVPAAEMREAAEAARAQAEAEAAAKVAAETAANVSTILDGPEAAATTVVAPGTPVAGVVDYSALFGGAANTTPIAA